MPLRSPFALWRQLSQLGLAAQSNREKRRIMLTNQVALLGLGFSAVSSTFYLYVGVSVLWPVVASAVSCAMALIVSLKLAQHGQIMLGRITLLLTGWFAILVHTWFLSIESGVHLLCFVGWTGTFLLTPRRHGWMILFAGALFIGLFFYGILYFQEPQPLIASMPQHFFTQMYVLNALGTYLGLSYVTILYYRQNSRAEMLLREATRAEASERRRSDRVLLNVLPESIAERLRNDTAQIADSIDDATIMFADIVGFTRIASKTPAAELVETLNLLFSRFDEIVERRGLEKIKTIGDAYMLAGGVPLHRVDHTEAVCWAGLDMLKAVRIFNLDHKTDLEIRIGIHSGPLVAGVIGRKKLAYDVWGDTVNVAARMEAESNRGRVTLSDDSYRKVKDTFECKAVGSLRIKGRGRDSIRTWQIVCPHDAETSSH